MTEVVDTFKIHVPGKNRGDIMLYALSTCPWCRKTKELLNHLGVEYDYIDVNLVKGEEFENIMKTVLTMDPVSSFPVLVINGKVIIGYRERQIRKAIKD